jgi:hypothetical protein
METEKNQWMEEQKKRIAKWGAEDQKNGKAKHLNEIQNGIPTLWTMTHQNDLTEEERKQYHEKLQERAIRQNAIYKGILFLIAAIVLMALGIMLATGNLYIFWFWIK